MNARETSPDTDGPEETARPEADEDYPETGTVAEAGEGEVPEEERLAESGLEAEIGELRDRLLRALAENENVLRRARREREDTAKYATAAFARDMLPIADNLHRALAAAPPELREADEAGRAFVEGLELTERELQSALARHGIRRISPQGERFDHNFHEALFEVPTADVPAGTVVQVVEDGYVIHDRLLRAARVGVARALPEPEDPHFDTTA